MKRFSFLYVLLLVFVFSCKDAELKNANSQDHSTIGFTPITQIKTVDFKGLEPLLTKSDNKTYVINFWATWCSPCVKELPYFEKIKENYSQEKVEVLLVSLDFPNQKKTRLLPFVNKKKLRSDLIHLDDVQEQVWIPKVSEEWSGALPATIIYNKNNRKFYEQSFTYETLEKELKQFLN